MPVAEVERRRPDALIYREYLEAAYTVPRIDRLVVNDVNEPRWDRRVPGCVLYAESGNASSCTSSTPTPNRTASTSTGSSTGSTRTVLGRSA